jgi:hypothetical protein
VFSIMTGLAPTLLALGIARAGSGLGRAVNEPVHNSLLADYYDIPVRPGVRRAPLRQRPRPVHRPAGGRDHGLLLGLAVALLRLLVRHVLFVLWG